MSENKEPIFTMPFDWQEFYLNDKDNLRLSYHMIQIMEYACKSILTGDYETSFERIEAHLHAAKEKYNRRHNNV